jgi:hypothetical protein
LSLAEIGTLIGSVGFPGTIALLLLIYIPRMNRENLRAVNGLTKEITRLTLAIQLSQQWAERTRWHPDFAAMAEKFLPDVH